MVTIKEVQVVFYLLTGTVLFGAISCSERVVNEEILCNQKLYLLKSDTLSPVNFDFNLSKENQFNSIQSQLALDICNGVYELNAKFPLSPEDTVEVVLIVERICEEDLYGLELGRAYGKSNQIHINQNGQILMEANVLSENSLEAEMQALFSSYDSGNGPLVFQIHWEDETPIPIRKRLYESIIEGYLGVVNDKALLHYQKGICDLNISEMKALKQRYRMAFKLKSSLPPPKFLLDHEIDADTIEQEILHDFGTP